MTRIETALAATGLSFASYAWASPPSGDYGVVEFSRGQDLIANGIHVERGTNGYVHYFTRSDAESIRNTIESVLNGLENCAWELDSVQYENETGYLHYEWRFGLYGES